MSTNKQTGRETKKYGHLNSMIPQTMSLADITNVNINFNAFIILFIQHTHVAACSVSYLWAYGFK